MPYPIEEYLPIVAALAEKYTSKESTSIPYETAQTLMGAVLYCVNAYTNYGTNTLQSAGNALTAREAYEAGYTYVVEKVRRAKALYDEIIDHFEDYGCENYRDTILKGMPVFFLRYDARYRPQSQLLMLDYPVMAIDGALKGVDLIWEYLRRVWMEAAFLRRFDRQLVVRILEGISLEYQTLYLDNLCFPVLQYALYCMIAGHTVAGLVEMEHEDWEAVRFTFQGDDLDRMEYKIAQYMKKTLEPLQLGEDETYFLDRSREIAARISMKLKG